MSWNLLGRLFRAALIPYASVSNLVCKRGSVDNTRLLPSQNVACSSEYFLLRVDYALEGSTFWLSKLCDFCRLFHVERSWHAYWFSEVIASGRHDWRFALWCQSIFFDLIETLSSSLRLNKSFRLFNFLQSPSLIWIAESNFLLSMNVMVSYNEFCHAGPSYLVFLQNVLKTLTDWVTPRSKFPRMDCSLNWSYFECGELRCESVKNALKQWFLNSSLFF